jgi:hypothetical protein
MEHGWVRNIDSDGEIEHLGFPVDGKKREVAEKARKRVNDKIYPEPLAPGTAKGRTIWPSLLGTKKSLKVAMVPDQP